MGLPRTGLLAGAGLRPRRDLVDRAAAGHPARGRPDRAGDRRPSGRDLDAQLLGDLRTQTGTGSSRGWPCRATPGCGCASRRSTSCAQLKHALAELDDDGEIAGRLGAGRAVLRAQPGVAGPAGRARPALGRWQLPQPAGPGRGRLGRSAWAVRAGYGLGSPASVGAPGSTLADVAAVVAGRRRTPGCPAWSGSSARSCGRPVLRSTIRSWPRSGARCGSPWPRRPAGCRPTIPSGGSSRCPGTCRPGGPGWSGGRSRAGDAVPARRGARPGPHARRAGLRPDRARRRRAARPAAGRVGDVVGPTLVASSKRPANLLAGDPPGKRQELTGVRRVAAHPRPPAAGRVRRDRRPGAAVVHSGRCAGARVPARPTTTPSPHQGRVFVNPGGRLSLVAWDPSRRVLGLGRRLRASGPPTFRDAQRAVQRAGERDTSGGSPRPARTPARPAATAARWPPSGTSATGRQAGEAHRRLAAAAAPGTATAARSTVSASTRSARTAGCGRCRCVGHAGPTGIALQEATSEHEVFRAEHGPSRRVRVAFSADGQFLLANRESPQRSQVDVWEL